MLQNNTINKFQHFPFHLVDFSTKCIHTSPILSSDTNNLSRINLDSLTPSPTESSDIAAIVAAAYAAAIPIASERLSNLALIKYQKAAAAALVAALEEDLKDLGSSSYEESFPWLLDANGKILDLYKDIRLFDDVQLVSRFLEQRFKMDKDLISEVKLTDLLAAAAASRLRPQLQFQGQNEITIGVAKAARLSDLYDHVANIYNKDQDSSSSSCARFHLLRAAASSAANAAGENNVACKLQQQIRKRNLAVFTLVGAPITLAVLNLTAVSFKDIFSIYFQLPMAATDNSNALFLLISNLFQKIPDFIKLLIKLILLIIVVIKLLGFESVSGFFFNAHYLKLYILVASSLVIIYQLINVYLLHKAAGENMKISEALPEFLINWLKEFEILSSSQASLKEYKNMCYTQISIYIVIILVMLLIL